MVKISQRLVKSREHTFSGTNGRRFITIHETANYRKGANAKMHAQLQINGFSATFHWQVDDKEAIQSFPHTVRCWHGGDGKGAGNYDSIAIEICVNEDGDYQQAVRNAAELVKMIMRDEGIPLKNVVQHNHWSGKDCPRHLRKGDKGISWHQFISMVKGLEVVTVSNPKTEAPVKDKIVKLVEDGYWGPLTTIALQKFFGTRADGVISGQYSSTSILNIPSAQIGTSGSLLIKAMQKWLGVKQDGFLGPITIKALQRKLGTPADGVISYPSLAVKELQRRLNAGKL